jgi:hypothetical protein
MRNLFLMLPLALLVARPCHGDFELTPETEVAFPTADVAKQILGARDEFVQCMSPFDRAARMKTDREVSEKDYLAFAQSAVLPWEEAEQKEVESVLRSLAPALTRLSVPMPKTIYLIKTTGTEEGNSPYTRSNALVLPRANLNVPGYEPRQLVCHELFHIISRANPRLREALYGAIGFTKCEEVELPPPLRSRKITNPDAPRNDHAIRVQYRGAAFWAVPILFSRSDKYDVKRGGEFFDYIQFQLMLVQKATTSSPTSPTRVGPHAQLVAVDEVTGFFEQVGRNTRYIIHPEEILAENFVFLVLGPADVPSPQIPQTIKDVLTSQRAERIAPQPSEAPGP